MRVEDVSCGTAASEVTGYVFPSDLVKQQTCLEGWRTSNSITLPFIIPQKKWVGSSWSQQQDQAGLSRLKLCRERGDEREGEGRRGLTNLCKMVFDCRLVSFAVLSTATVSMVAFSA